MSSPVELHTPRSPEHPVRRIALVGNPNTGKTTLFNRLSGLKAKTSNFPGTTLEARVARVKAGIEGGRDGDLIDLPGIYSLELDQLEARVCRDVLAGSAAPRGEPLGEPECAVVVLDAMNLARNLMLAGELFRRRLPTVVVVNMIDLARRRGVQIDAAKLANALGCEVVLTNARAGEGLDAVRIAIRRAKLPTPIIAVPGGQTEGGLASETSFAALREWAEAMYDAGTVGAPAAEHDERCPKCGYDLSKSPGPPAMLRCPECGMDLEIPETRSDRADRVLLNPALGLIVFAAVMTGLFYTLFVLAQYPMGWIEAIFGWSSKLITTHLPEGVLRDLLADGIVGGVGATLVFLPQICLLFFLISLLEDTGYLARGAFLMDRLLRPFGLPGHAFVPLLSSHACALPGIMACRGIPDRKERLATILVAPFMTCSARLPVYVLLTTLLFPGKPLQAALAFVGCYVLGILAGVFSALIARRTILRGKSRPMALELPCYKWPSLRSAALVTVERGKVFLKSAGTNILMICIVLWWLGAYPKVGPSREAALIRSAVAAAREQDAGLTAMTRESLGRYFDAAPHVPDGARGLEPEAIRQVRVAQNESFLEFADVIDSRHQASHSYLGRLGRLVQPVFSPLGYDWQLTIGVVASFAAREVFVSTMSIVVSGQEEEDETLFQNLATAKRDDGVTPIFTAATSWSLLVYYVLAMQCLPTLAVTAREAGSRKWALLQLVWMCGLAYVGALIVHAIMK